ncbi:MAG: hypothetical protein NC248_00425 [Bacteroides sp.]|nr:hypothetical protein [Bacteroides sp.]MCM1389157.1 hypothetical protein [Bacteroides sp.]
MKYPRLMSRLGTAMFYVPSVVLFLISIICFFFYDDCRWQFFQGNRWQENMILCLIMIFATLPHKAQNIYTAPLFVALAAVVHYMVGDLSDMAELVTFSAVKILLCVSVAVQVYNLIEIVGDEYKPYMWITPAVIAAMAALVLLLWDDELFFNHWYTIIKVYYVNYPMGVVALFAGIASFLIVKLDSWMFVYYVVDEDDEEYEED